MREAKDMEREVEVINKNDTLIIKAVAIILMFIHHFFGFPNWYIENINFNNSMNIMIEVGQISQICVGIFAFITGYLYYFNKNKTYKYSIRKITDIIFSYWFVCISIIIFALIMGFIKFDLEYILKELLLFDNKIMCFCWYVRFYILTMIILPVFTKMFNKSKFLSIVIVMLTKNLLIILILKNLLNSKILFETFQEFIIYFPIVLIGYIFANFSIFNKIENKIVRKHINSIFLEIVLSISLICISLMIKKILDTKMIGNIQYYLYSIDMICAPIFIIGLINIIKKIKITKFTNVFLELGKYSMLMWFIHCIFFNVCNKFFQPMLYYFNNYVIVLVLGLGLSYTLAAIINVPTRKIIEIKNKLLGIQYYILVKIISIKYYN